MATLLWLWISGSIKPWYLYLFVTILMNLSPSWPVLALVVVTRFSGLSAGYFVGKLRSLIFIQTHKQKVTSARYEKSPTFVSILAFLLWLLLSRAESLKEHWNCLSHGYWYDNAAGQWKHLIWNIDEQESCYISTLRDDWFPPQVPQHRNTICNVLNWN